jgi:N-acetylglucosamine malate deacetylase 2
MTSVLLVAAHPDDETSAGGLLARYAEEGYHVCLLFLTRGEGGPCGDPPLCEREELGRVREQEARDAAAILGVEEVTFLPYIDGARVNGILQPIAAPLDEIAIAIQTQIERLRPEIVITHGSDGEYGHPQHIQAHQATLQALRGLQPWRPESMLTFCAAHPDLQLPDPNKSDQADWVVDITPWKERKLRSFQAHRTQFNIIVAHYQHLGSAFMEEHIESYRHWSEYERETE